MIMITGGAFAGKLEFARTHFGLNEDEIVDGTDCAPEDVFTAKCIVHYERLIRRLMETDGQDVRYGAVSADEKTETVGTDEKTETASTDEKTEAAGMDDASKRRSLWPLPFTDRLLCKNPDAIVIMNEIGSGIIPLEKSERLWREQTGRAGCRIAERSDTVIRLCSGIPEAIKGTLR